DIVCPFAPGVQWALGLARNAACAPERQHRAADFFSRSAVGFIMGEIGGAAGTVILAGRMDAQRVGEERAVVGERARIKRRQTLGLGAGRRLPVPEGDGVRADDIFWAWRR